MKNILGILAFILIIVWVVGIFAFAAVVGSFIHIALVLAVIAFGLRYIKWKKDDKT